MHIINLSKVETVFPFFKKAWCYTEQGVAKAAVQAFCTSWVRVGKVRENSPPKMSFYQINFQCAYPNYISQFWPDYHFNIYVWWCHLCQVWSHVKQLLCILLQLPDIFPIYERHFSNIRETGCVRLAHMCRAAHGTGLLARVPADLSDADRRPSSALQAWH